MPAAPPSPLPAAAAEKRSSAALTEGKSDNAPQALVPVAPAVEEPENSAYGPQILRLPVELEVSVPVREFRVRHLLALAPGEVIESQWVNGNDLPLAAGEVQLAWAEFEVLETKLAVRITRVA